MWSIWDNCDVTCGDGIQQRTRACDNPYPVFDGFNCSGNDLQTQTCKTTPCPGVILVYILYLIALIVLEMTYRHIIACQGMILVYAFSLTPSRLCFVRTSGFTHGCVFM